MSKLSDAELTRMITVEHQDRDVAEMARELLELREENKALIEMAHGWHIEELRERLAAAERVVDKAGKVLTLNYPWPKYGEELDEALQEYDKVVNTTACKSAPNA